MVEGDAGRDSAGPGGAARLEAVVGGLVQGVGFRWWVRREALARGLTGVAENLPDGTVRVEACGPRGACADLLAALRGPGAPGRVTAVTESWAEPGPAEPGFEIR